MNKENKRLEDSGAFLDLMGKKERIEWEKKKREELGIQDPTDTEKPFTKSKKRADRHEDNEADTIIADEKPLIPIDTDSAANPDTLKIAVGEVNAKASEKKIVTEPTSTKKTTRKAKRKDNVKLTTISGLATILCFCSYIYISLYATFNNNAFKLINSIMVITMTIVFSLSVLCNRKFSKILSMINLLILLIYIAFNILIIISF